MGESVIKERPILFQGAMVRALLDGRKTQTRRLVKPQKLSGAHDIATIISTPDSLAAFIRHRCPYGLPGDRLWVRESFMHSAAEYEPMMSMTHALVPAETAYMADHLGDARGLGWKPSIHMPRALSRILLEITEVRVQRLQEISEEDAIAEGVELIGGFFGHRLWRDYGPPDDGDLGEPAGLTSPIDSYRTLWDSINAKTAGAAWADNPWVWVVSFKRVEAPHA